VSKVTRTLEVVESTCATTFDASMRNKTSLESPLQIIDSQILRCTGSKAVVIQAARIRVVQIVKEDRVDDLLDTYTLDIRRTKE